MIFFCFNVLYKKRIEKEKKGLEMRKENLSEETTRE